MNASKTLPFKSSVGFRAGILAIAFLFVCRIPASSAENYVIIPARGLPAEPARAVLVDVLHFVLEKAGPGDRVFVVDPVDHRLLAAFPIPSGTLRQRANDRGVRDGVAGIKRAFLENPARSPWQRAAVCLPETLRFLRSQVVRPRESAVVLFVGNPLHQSEDAAFEFRDGAVPSDGWLFASAEDSPFAVGPEAGFTGWRVHLATIPPAWGQSDWQRSEIQRFWSAYCGLSGGKLVTLADPKLALQRLADGASDSLDYRPVDREDHSRLFRKRVFVRGQEIETTVKTADETVVSTSLLPEPPAEPSASVIPPPSDPVPPPTPIVAPTPIPAPVPVAIAPEPAPKPPVDLPRIEVLVEKAEVTLPKVGPGKLGIGLIWETLDGKLLRGIDLDLYVSVRGIDGECNWRKKDVPNRKQTVLHLFDDVRNARGIATTGAVRETFEFVEITRPVALEDVSVWVNVYTNRSVAPLRALFRLETSDGRTFTQIFEWPGTIGDKGDGADRRDSSVEWHRIDLLKLVNSSSAGETVSAP